MSLYFCVLADQKRQCGQVRVALDDYVPAVYWRPSGQGTMSLVHRVPDISPRSTRPSATAVPGFTTRNCNLKRFLVTRNLVVRNSKRFKREVDRRSRLHAENGVDAESERKSENDNDDEHGHRDVGQQDPDGVLPERARVSETGFAPAK